ncbi:MAG: SurA N-terminal domain-containing protein [Acidobacteria bacterium]|nr:SurA N-terminal domain-containing protein [Acidobacteriota bacterium]MDW7984091.1 SurA N-terminal domain-containing protein [Acidobacteriota bacterium]
MGLILVIGLRGVSPGVADVVEAVIAQVNGDFIYLSDLRHEEELLLRQVHAQVLPEKRAEVFQDYQAKLLDGLIERQLFLQKAKEMGLNPDPQVQATLERIKKENNISSDEELRAALERENIRFEDFVDTIRVQVLQRMVLLSYIQPRLVITDQDLRAYYQRHADEFRTPEQWHFYQLQVPKDSPLREVVERELLSMSPSPEFQAKVASMEGVQFAAIGPIVPEQIRSEVRPALSQATPQTWVGPLDLNDRWVWLWLDRREGGAQLSFETVRDQIYERVAQERADQARDRYVEELKKNSFIRIYCLNLPEPYRALYEKSSYCAQG